MMNDELRGSLLVHHSSFRIHRFLPRLCGELTSTFKKNGSRGGSLRSTGHENHA